MLRFLSVGIGNLKLTKAFRLEKGLSADYSDLGSEGRFLCLGIPLMAKGPKPDFNNGPGDNSDNGCVFDPSGVYSSPTRIMALPMPIQCWSDGRYFYSGAHLWSPGECNIWPRGPGLTSIMSRG